MGLSHKIDHALDETRIFVLIVQVLIGFELRAYFEPGFGKLAEINQTLMLVSTTLLLGCMGVLMMAASYSQIVEDGENSPEFHGLVSRNLEWALIPFAMALGLAIHAVCSRVLGMKGAFWVGAGVTLFALCAWFGVERIVARKRTSQMTAPQRPSEKNLLRKGTKLSKKVDHLLTEARVVLPGTQALLGFQLLLFMTTAFEAMPDWMQRLHIVSLLLVAASAILLMSLSAYHRIVEHGEDTREFHQFASSVLLLAMLPLSLGIIFDFYLLFIKVTRSQPWSIGIAGGMWLLFMVLWYVYPLWVRRRRQ